MKAIGETLLYEKNVFFMSCTKIHVYNNDDVWDCNLSPITRRFVFSEHQLWECSSITKVCHWKVYIQGPLEDHPCSLEQFCRAICHSHPRSVEVGVARVGNRGASYMTQFDISRLLEPLKMLRGVTKASILDEKTFRSTYDDPNSPGEDDYPSRLEGHSLLVEDLVKQMESGDPVELSIDIFLSLLRYAKAFEDNHSFHMPERVPLAEIDERCERHRCCCPTSHYLKYYCSLRSMEAYKEPLELMILNAKAACDRNYVVDIKEERARVLEYLDEQYYWITSIADSLIQFIKEEKIPGGLFDANQHLDCFSAFWCSDEDSRIAAAMVHLEDYFESFNRPLSFDMRVKLRRRKEPFGKGDIHTERDRLLKQLNVAIEYKDFQNFRDLYQKAVEILNLQYLEIQAARKDVFQHDLEAAVGPNDIDVEVSRYDEKVN